MSLSPITTTPMTTPRKVQAGKLTKKGENALISSGSVVGFFIILITCCVICRRCRSTRSKPWYDIKHTTVRRRPIISDMAPSYAELSSGSNPKITVSIDSATGNVQDGCPGEFEIVGMSEGGQKIGGTIKIESGNIPRGKKSQPESLLQHPRISSKQAANESNYDASEYGQTDVDVQLKSIRVRSSSSSAESKDMFMLATDVAGLSIEVSPTASKLHFWKDENTESTPIEGLSSRSISEIKVSIDNVTENVAVEAQDVEKECHGKFEIVGMSGDGRKIRGTLTIEPDYIASLLQPPLVSSKQAVSEGSYDVSEYGQTDISVISVGSQDDRSERFASEFSSEFSSSSAESKDMFMLATDVAGVGIQVSSTASSLDFEKEENTESTPRHEEEFLSRSHPKTMVSFDSVTGNVEEVGHGEIKVEINYDASEYGQTDVSDQLKAESVGSQDDRSGEFASEFSSSSAESKDTLMFYNTTEVASASIKESSAAYTTS